MDALRARRFELKPNLGASYEVRTDVDPGRFVDLDAPVTGWGQSSEVRRALERGNWGPKAEETLFSAWNRDGASAGDRIRGAERTFQDDRADRRAAVDWSGMRPEARHALDEAMRLGEGRGATLDSLRAAFDPVMGAEADPWRGALRRLEATPNPGNAHLSEELRRLGLAGHRFRDANSRRGQASPTHNLVVFDDAPIEIVRRYRRGGLVAGLG